MNNWSGNILGDGAWLTCEHVKVHVLKFQHGLKDSVWNKTRWNRSWVIAVYRDDPYRLDDSPILEVVVFDRLADDARREAEIMGEWADARYRSEVNGE